MIEQIVHIKRRTMFYLSASLTISVALFVFMTISAVHLSSRLTTLEQVVEEEQRERMRLYEDIEQTVIPTLRELSEDIRLTSRTIRDMREESKAEKKSRVLQ